MPAPKQPKTNKQLGAIFTLARNVNCADEDLRDLCEDCFGFRSLKKLNFDQANHLIKRLGGTPFSKQRKSRRTEQYHKQVAGVKTIPTATHIDHLNKLARGRGITPEGLASLCNRMLKHPKPQTSTEVNQIIEAIKAMNKRDKVAQFPQKTKEAA